MQKVTISAPGWSRHAASLEKTICWRTIPMKKFLLATVALVAVGATAPALAADLAPRTFTKAPAYVSPIYNWTGFYIGGHLGGAFSGDGSLQGDSRFFGGIQGGVDYQFATN